VYLPPKGRLERGTEVVLASGKRMRSAFEFFIGCFRVIRIIFALQNSLATHFA
jgi:hypothetical protein